MQIVVMGPAGAGKTTVGVRLAARLGWTFRDADVFHPASNVAKMHGGMPLTDEDRSPWLEALNALLVEFADRGASIVLACSALKESYRERLARGVPHVRFVYLKADQDVLRARLRTRRGHFADQRLLESQLATLEEPSEAIVIDARLPPDLAVEAIVRALPIS